MSETQNLGGNGAMKIGVIWNPEAGNRGSRRRMERFRRRYQAAAAWFPTATVADVAEATREAVRQGCVIVGAAGGDGTVHHVGSTLLLLPEAETTTLAVIPVGTANDYAYSVAKQFGVAELDDQRQHAVDVGLVTKTGSGTSHFFLESLGVGVSGAVAAEAAKIRHRSGTARYGLAAARVIFRGLQPNQLQLQWDQEPPQEVSTLLLTLLLGQREGNMLFDGEAQLDDGLFSVVQASDCSVGEALRLLPRLLWSGLPRAHRSLFRRQASSLSLTADAPLVAHVDGEPLCESLEDERRLHVKLLHQRLRVKVCRC